MSDSRLLDAPVGTVIAASANPGEKRLFKKHDLGFWFPVKQWRQGWLKDDEIDDYPYMRAPGASGGTS